MVLDEQTYSRQVSTTLTDEQFARWQAICGQEQKSSFMLLREVVLTISGDTTRPDEI